MGDQERRSGEHAGEELGAAALSEAILQSWRVRLRADAMAQPRMDERGLRERQLVTSLVKAAECDDAETLAAVAAAAAAYADSHPRARLDVSHICDELGLLHDTAWRTLKLRAPVQADATASDAAGRVLRFDRALRVAMKAATAGGFEGRSCE